MGMRATKIEKEVEGEKKLYSQRRLAKKESGPRFYLS